MTADHHPPRNGDDLDDGGHHALVGDLRVLLAAHVDESVATDAAWAEIVRGARDHGAARRRRHTAVAAVLATAALIAVFVVVRLEASRDEGARVTTEPEIVPDPTEGTNPESWVRLLARAPSIDLDGGFVSVYDLERARRDVDIDVLAPRPSIEAWNAHSLATFGHPDIVSYAVGPGASPDELRAELGISHEQFDQVVVYNPAPALNRYVAIGRFDPEAIAAAVAADPQWSPMLEVREYRGMTYYRWGDDLRLYRKSPARDLGNGGRLVVGDGWVSWSLTDAEAEGTIDAWLDPRASLAVTDELRAAVDDGDRLGLTQMTVTIAGTSQLIDANPGGPPDRGSTSPPDPVPGLPPIDRPQTWWRGSSGVATDVERYGLGYAGPDQAVANLGAYEQSWRWFATDADVDVQQAGSSVVATLNLPEVEGDSVPGQVSDGSIRRYAGTFLRYFNVQW